MNSFTILIEKNLRIFLILQLKVERKISK